MTSSIQLLVLLVAFPALLVNGHGWLEYPPTREIARATFNVDSINQPIAVLPPNAGEGAVCRGFSPSSSVTPLTAGTTISLKYRVRANHIGPCYVYLMDVAGTGGSNAQLIGTKDNCAAEDIWDKINGVVKDVMTVHLPAHITGRKVLRFHWVATHRVSVWEHFEDCADVMISSGNGNTNVVQPVSNTNGGTCGNGVQGTCPPGECCSKWGYCGTGADFCPPQPHSNPQTSTHQGMCGHGQQGRCPHGQCCSRWGHCGKGPEYGC